MTASGGVELFDVDQMMELDMDVHPAGALLPTAAFSTMADSLPGLGLVAAVLGAIKAREIPRFAMGVGCRTGRRDKPAATKTTVIVIPRPPAQANYCQSV